MPRVICGMDGGKRAMVRADARTSADQRRMPYPPNSCWTGKAPCCDTQGASYFLSKRGLSPNPRPIGRCTPPWIRVKAARRSAGHEKAPGYHTKGASFSSWKYWVADPMHTVAGAGMLRARGRCVKGRDIRCAAGWKHWISGGCRRVVGAILVGVDVHVSATGHAAGRRRAAKGYGQLTIGQIGAGEARQCQRRGWHTGGRSM
jgi:hypothetical protein